ncbi:uncharacterized protein [Argopecten irradians]|uniref:uncharacterized protein n=1 Tax=Argopecten irradians TaxID=31199 RepID=UPI00371EB679
MALAMEITWRSRQKMALHMEMTFKDRDGTRYGYDLGRQTEDATRYGYDLDMEMTWRDNHSRFENLSQNLKDHTEKLKHDLDKLTAETLSVYQKMMEDNTKLIQKYKQDLELYGRQLRQQIQECKKVLQCGSRIQIYDTSCEVHSLASHPVKLILATATFTPNIYPQGHLDLAIGKVTTSWKAPSTDHQKLSPYQPGDKGKRAGMRKKLLTETKVVEEWWSPCGILSICPTTDDQAWTSDYSKALTLLGRKGTVVQEVTHMAGINDISLSPTTQSLWACDSKNNILELVSGQLTHRFRTSKEANCICVTLSNHVIVGMPKHISKYTTQGKMVPTKRSARTGKPTVYIPFRIAECPVTNNIAVIDEGDQSHGAQHVVVMDTDFTELFVYRGDIPGYFNPFGVQYDSVGNIIIADHEECRIMLVSGIGELLRILYQGKDLTWAIGIDRMDTVWTKFESKVNLLQYSRV